jgi:hypothetical protein
MIVNKPYQIREGHFHLDIEAPRAALARLEKLLRLAFSLFNENANQDRGKAPIKMEITYFLK